MKEKEKRCISCARRYKQTRGIRCRVFLEIPDNCWAWTDDQDWDKKIKEDIERYKLRYGVSVKWVK